MEKIILTLEGKKELEQRLNVLKNELIPQVVQRIKVAREQGDLSENAEYTAAREEQGKLEGEKHDIETKLKYGEVITATSKKDVVEVGTKLRYLDIEENEEYVFTIVGTAEADLTKGKISNESPLGKALLGKAIGEDVVVEAQAGVIEYEVLKIDRSI